MAKLKTEEKVFNNFKVYLVYDETKDVYGIVMVGSFDTEPAIDFRKYLQDEIFKQRHNYIVDTELLEYISSTGISVLASFDSNKRLFALYSEFNDYIKRPCKLVGLDRLLKFYKNLDELKDKVTSEFLDEIKEYKHFAIVKAPRERWVKILLSYVPKEKAVSAIREMTPIIMQVEKAKSLSLPSDEKYAACLYKFMERVLYKEAKVPKEKITEDDLEFAAKEIFTNACRHGYRYSKEGIIDVEYDLKEGEVVIDVIDYGTGIKGVPMGGKGIPMLRKIFDAVFLTPAPKTEHKGITLGEGTKVRLVKFLK